MRSFIKQQWSDQWLEHCTSSAKVVGSIPREHTYWQYKCITWMHCTSLWIKASAKCINVNVTSLMSRFTLFNYFLLFLASFVFSFSFVFILFSQLNFHVFILFGVLPSALAFLLLFFFFFDLFIDNFSFALSRSFFPSFNKFSFFSLTFAIFLALTVLFHSYLFLAFYLTLLFYLC